MKKLIVNGDDFGLSPGVNKGILRAFNNGILTSTTMLVNLDYFEDAVEIAHRTPELPVGIHMTLLWGSPVSPMEQVASLVDKNGFFAKDFSTLAQKYFLNHVVKDEVELEFCNQIKKFLDAGLTPTHVDSHVHIHILPDVLSALLSAMKQHGIDKIRFQRRPKSVDHLSLKSVIKQKVFDIFSKKNERAISAARAKTPDYHLGTGLMDRFTIDNVVKILQNLSEGTTELSCHPGVSDEAMYKYSNIPPNRDRELSTLTDPKLKEFINQEKLSLISYRDL